MLFSVQAGVLFIILRERERIKEVRKVQTKKMSMLLVAMGMMSCVFLASGGRVFGEYPPLKGKGLAPVTDEKIYFRGWAYMPHIPQDFVKKYNTELGGNVDFAVVTGDYGSMMEAKFIAKAPIDVLYSTMGMACRFYDGGWILPVDSMANAEEIKADMYPHIRDAWTYKGKLLGLSYFTSINGVVLVNLKKLRELGMTEKDYPKTWDELYDQLYEVRAKGLEKPFLPWWMNEFFGINEGFVYEVMNRGGRIADPETHEPLVTVDGPAGDTLRAWKRLWNDGLAPEGILTMKQPDQFEAWGSGEYLYGVFSLYDLRRFNDPHYSTFAGDCSVLPYRGQSWGTLNPCLYLITNRARTEDHTHDVMAFVTWYGYKDHEGEPYVALKWLEEAGLFSAYRSAMESPEAEPLAKKMIARPEDYKVALELYEKVPYPKGCFNVVWSPEFLSWLKDTLQVFLAEEKPVDETIQAIRDKITELNQKYGIY
jgi:multiple sugar transport system substrate-binding protein